MWLLSTSIAFITWALVSIFYKCTGKVNEYTHLKTGILVGLIMGGHALVYMLYKGLSINFIDVLKYFPISVLYIASMIIGYRGYKFIELSISSPVQNTSGVITAILLLLFFKEKYDFPFYIAVVLIFIGIIWISLIELKDNKKKRIEYKKKNNITKVIAFTMIFPLLYCVLDGAGTFLDGIYLDKLELISEDSALVAYELTFLLYGIVTFIYLKIKNVKIKLINEKPKIAAAVFETAGQFFYVYAMSGNATISAPIVGSYCILSMILSRIFLKEKLSLKEYMAIGLVLIGIVILAVMDI